MTVDFNGIGSGQVNTRKSSTEQTQTPQKPQPAAPDQTGAQATRGENVSLSSQAKDLKQLEQKLNSYPETNDERIAQIKSALADGSYKVDAEKLAQKMLELDKSIFG